MCQSLNSSLKTAIALLHLDHAPFTHKNTEEIIYIHTYIYIYIYIYKHYLSNWHGAQDVEEDEGTVGVIFTQEVAVWEALDIWQRDKWKFGYNTTIKAEMKKKKKKK